MKLQIQKLDTWAASLEDTPGNLAVRLNALAEAGINLQFVIARRAPDKPGTGVVFVTPIQGKTRTRAAVDAGFTKTNSLHTVQVQGSDKPGRGAELVQALAKAGLNLRGVSAASIGNKFVCYIALDTEQDAAKATRVLRRL